MEELLACASVKVAQDIWWVSSIRTGTQKWNYDLTFLVLKFDSKFKGRGWTFLPEASDCETRFAGFHSLYNGSGVEN